MIINDGLVYNHIVLKFEIDSVLNQRGVHTVKKLLIYLGIIVLLFVLLFALNSYTRNASLAKYEDKALELYDTDPKNLRNSTLKQLDDPNYQNIILPDELEKRLNDGEDLIVYFFSPECSYCVASTPILSELVDEVGIDVLQYNVLEFEQGFKDYQFTSTPTTIVFKEGKEVDRVVGGFSAPHLREQMKQFLQHYADANDENAAENEEQAS